MSASGTVFAHITIAPTPAEVRPPAALSETNAPSTTLNQTNQLPSIQLHPPETPKSRHPAPYPSRLAPGIYLSQPFSCMIKVPGPQPDDDCIIPATIPTNSIPNFKPKLKFEPLPPQGM